MSKRWEVFIWFVIVLGLSLCFYGIRAGYSQTLSAKQVDELKAAPVGAEIKTLRTKNAETFKADDKGKLQTKIYTHDKFYYDTTAKEYKERTFTYDGKAFGSRGYTVEYKPLFDENTVNLTVAKEQTATGVKETITLKNVDAPTLLSWTIVTNATYTLDVGAVTFWKGEDVLFVTQAPTAWDGDNKPVKVAVTVDKGVLRYDVDVKAAVYPVTVDPTTSIISTNDVWIYSYDDVYLTARNADAGDGIVFTALEIGQQISSYQCSRSFLSFAIPEMFTIISTSLFLDGKANDSTTDFEVYIHTSTYNTPGVKEDFDLFNGHQASGAYNGVVLNDTWNSSSYSDNWNEFVFNAAGLDTIFTKKESTLKIVLISKEDFDGSVPTASEKVTFEPTTTIGKEPYLSIVYTLPSTLESRKNLLAPRLYSNGNNVPLYKK